MQLEQYLDNSSRDNWKSIFVTPGTKIFSWNEDYILFIKKFRQFCASESAEYEYIFENAANELTLETCFGHPYQSCAYAALKQANIYHVFFVKLHRHSFIAHQNFNYPYKRTIVCKIRYWKYNITSLRSSCPS